MPDPAAVWLANSLHDDSDWRPALRETLASEAFANLARALQAREAAGERVFPPQRDCFTALNATPLSRVRVVILGQDPYHGPGQAHGLCFSVRPDVPVPPSLKNIFAEIKRDLGHAPPAHGCLGYWAQQGVLLLNAVLTVSAGSAGSHQGLGWEAFTDAVVSALLSRNEPLVFMLWGRHAQQKAARVDARHHLCLATTHPSPLSAHRGFLGCGHFSQANAWIAQQGLRAIDWRLPPRDRLDEEGFLRL